MLEVAGSLTPVPLNASRATALLRKPRGLTRKRGAAGMALVGRAKIPVFSFLSGFPHPERQLEGKFENVRETWNQGPPRKSNLC